MIIDEFCFSTSFKLIRHATSSLARHSVNFTDRKTLSEAVTFDLGRYLTFLSLDITEIINLYNKNLY